MKITKAQILRQNSALQLKNKRLEEELFSERNQAKQIYTATPSPDAPFVQLRNASAGAICSPPSRPSIGEAANRIHDRLDKAHALIDTLTDRLISVCQPTPAVASPTAGSSPAPCSHIGTLEGARERVEVCCAKLHNILDTLMI